MLPSGSSLGTKPSPALLVQGWDWEKKIAVLFSPGLVLFCVLSLTTAHS